MAPPIFSQVFTVLGSVNERANNRTIAVPLVYALLTSKRKDEYLAVLNAVASAAERLHIEDFFPEVVMTDFELAIIRAAHETFPLAFIALCFFHLKQSLYRHIQSLGLAVEYNNVDDRSLKIFVHKIAALAFIPEGDVMTVFRELKAIAPAIGRTADFVTYFEQTYVGVTARGRRLAAAPTYQIGWWNQYNAVLQDQDTTNNASEGWHNRFKTVVAKHHPDLFSCIVEFQKEQADIEVCLLELSQGKSVREGPKKKWLQSKERLKRMVESYQDYKTTGRVMEYLETIANTIVLQ